MANDRLSYIVELIDRVTSPLRGIQNHLQNLGDSATEAYAKVQAGVDGLTATVSAVNNLLEPAQQVSNALGEVKSLGVAEEELSRLEETALGAAGKYGIAAADFIKSSYDIQSAISGLKPGQLGVVTESMSALAKGTKSSVGEMTSLMGTMYGIFQDDADKMGIDAFSQRVASMTAKSVQAFKTTGPEMEAAFSAIGAAAKTAGIKMEDHFAVLGMMQSTMSGSEAATKYKAFLTGVVQAQDKLGLSFVDSHGKMLPTVDILNKIKKKYGDLDALELANLKKAFGSDEAIGLITGMITKTDQLQGNIEAIKGADYTLVEDMAQAIADQGDKTSASINALLAKVGSLFLPYLDEVTAKIAEVADVLREWVDANPELAQHLTTVGLVILGAIGIISAFAVASGVAALAAGALGTAFAVLTSPITLVIAAVAAVAAGIYYLYTQWDTVKAYLSETTWGQAILTVLNAVGAAFGVAADILKGVFILAVAAVLIVIETFVSLGTSLYNIWTSTTASLAETSWGQTLIAAFNLITSPLELFKMGAEVLGGVWLGVKANLSDTSWGQAILGVIDSIMGAIERFKQGWAELKAAASEKIDAVANWGGGVMDSATQKASGAWSSVKSFVGLEDEGTSPSTASYGGARALGGTVTAGNFYRVNEFNHETLNSGR